MKEKSSGESPVKSNDSQPSPAPHDPTCGLKSQISLPSADRGEQPSQALDLFPPAATNLNSLKVEEMQVPKDGKQNPGTLDVGKIAQTVGSAPFSETAPPSKPVDSGAARVATTKGPSPKSKLSAMPLPPGAGSSPMALPSDYVQFFENPKEQPVHFGLGHIPAAKGPTMEPTTKVTQPAESPIQVVHMYNSKKDLLNSQELSAIVDNKSADGTAKKEPKGDASEKTQESTDASSTKERVIKCRNGVPESLIKSIKAFMEKQPKE